MLKSVTKPQMTLDLKQGQSTINTQPANVSTGANIFIYDFLQKRNGGIGLVMC